MKVEWKKEDSDPGQCMGTTKYEGMLVCIIRGGHVLISSRENFNSVVIDVLVPGIL
jgi:hypothetical protein